MPNLTLTIAYGTIYYRKHVEITGTKLFPQTLMTNVSPLNIDEDGNPFPTFTNLQKIIVKLQEYQERKVFLVNEPSISGGNLTFQVAASDAGEQSPNGKSYADIIINVNP